MKTKNLSERTAGDISSQVAKILRGLGNPEPPIDLPMVRDLLKLDQQYYSAADDSFLREVISRMKVAGLQVIQRPGLLVDVVRSLNLKALYLPDQKRILLDQDLPKLKHRWNSAHEIGHDIIPWHAGMMLGDTEQTLTPACHESMEAEANYAAGQLLFLADRFVQEALDTEPSLKHIHALSKSFGNTVTSTLWRFVEAAHDGRPMVALVTGHPHPDKRKQDFNPAIPCRYCVQSPAFRQRFAQYDEVSLFEIVVGYSGSQRGGPLGEVDVQLRDVRGEVVAFHFETFFNSHEALTLAYA